jgi:hypothetical protein
MKTDTPVDSDVPVTRTEWPREHGLLSAMHNIIAAKEDFHHALVQATTVAELNVLHQMCEDVVKGFDHLGAMALHKADGL